MTTMERHIFSGKRKRDDYLMTNEALNYKETIMSKDSAEMYKQLFHERHEKAFNEEIHGLSAAIESFHGDSVAVWHCCTYDGDGYYTISNSARKCYVRSAYELERVGGVWSMQVYERLYMGQVNLMKFLEAVKAEICSKYTAKMPLKTLYIDYLLTNLENQEKSGMEYGFCNSEEKLSIEIAKKYQTEFTEQYSEQIEIYTAIAENGGDFLDYYNGAKNYEYPYVSEVLTDSINRIYDKRKQLEACGMWDKARETIDVLRSCKNMMRK